MSSHFYAINQKMNITEERCFYGLLSYPRATRGNIYNKHINYYRGETEKLDDKEMKREKERENMKQRKLFENLNM